MNLFDDLSLIFGCCGKPSQSLHTIIWVLLGFTGFYWVLLGFTGFYRVLLGFLGFDEFSKDSNGIHKVLQGLIKSEWASIHTHTHKHTQREREREK